MRVSSRVSFDPKHHPPSLVIHQLHLLDPAYHLLDLVHRAPIRSILSGRNLLGDQHHQQTAVQLNQPTYLTLW
jgi:hypothetical protein